MKQNEPKFDLPDHAQFPVLPLRDVVVYPHMVIPLFVGREKSIRALDLAMQNNRRIVLVAQRSAEVDDPGPGDVYAIGTLSNVLQLLRLPDGTVKVLVEGGQRVAIERFTETDPCFMVAVTLLEAPLEEGDSATQEVQALMRALLSTFERYIKVNKKIPGEVLTSVSSIEDPHRVADTIAAHMALKLDQKQKILEIQNLRERLIHLLALVEGEIDILQVEKRIRGRVKQQMEKSQREY
ncbi:MAG TPA: endopeptidase La, partial [Candidatus Competibacteraceae bacterium]|nr:endopeptidase La [Candidatus Competibacteraceae bacterium]